jgi:hypothetical protein
MFAIFRASLGAFYLHVLRFKTDFKSITIGFWVYIADLFGPVRCIYRLTFKLERFTSRRVMYALLGILLSYYEYRGAKGFFLMKLIISFLDMAIIQSNYGKMTHYLELNVDFCQNAFPHSGAMPWASIDLIKEIADCCGRLIVKRGGSSIAGMGVVLKSAGRAMLYSVAHVTKDGDFVQFDKMNLNIMTPDFRHVTKDDDPMVAMKVEVDDCPDVELLTPSEVYDVKQLVFVNSPAIGEEYVCMTDRFEIRRGKLHAIVNLRKGDSGGPCFAVLADGIIRLCGVVSQGNPRNGGGNIISFCYSEEKPDHDSSDDDNPLADVTHFNKVRRIGFRSDDARERVLTMHHDLHCTLASYEEDFEAMKGWPRKLNYEDFTMSDDEICAMLGRVEALHARSASPQKIENKREKEVRFEDERDDDYGNGKAARNKRRKSSRKDKGARKRAVMAARNALLALRGGMPLDAANSLFDLIMMGFDISPYDYPIHCNGSTTVYTPEPPDPEYD